MFQHYVYEEHFVPNAIEFEKPKITAFTTPFVEYRFKKYLQEFYWQVSFEFSLKEEY